MGKDLSPNRKKRRNAFLTWACGRPADRSADRLVIGVIRVQALIIRQRRGVDNPSSCHAKIDEFPKSRTLRRRSSAFGGILRCESLDSGLHSCGAGAPSLNSHRILMGEILSRRKSADESVKFRRNGMVGTSVKADGSLVTKNKGQLRHRNMVA